MKKLFILAALLISGSVSLTAQTPSPSPKAAATLALGEVTAISAEQKTVTLKTKDGEIAITLTDTTEYKKASPENPSDLTLATPGALADIGIGDRLVASGKFSEDKKSMISRRIILLTKAAISQRQQAESEAWAKGINGKVATVNPVTKELTVTMRGLMGERTVTITDTSNTKFLRYAPESVKFSDAVAGNFTELKTGDQLRARGTRSDDGTHFVAEEIISGSFRTAGGVITAIDTAKNEVTINDVLTKKPVTIALSETTTLRKFPAEMAQRYVAFQSGAGGMRPLGTAATSGTGQTPGGQQGQTPAQGGQGTNGGGRPGGGARDLDAMLDKLPAITLADLKVGDSIAVSSIPAHEPNRVSAVKLLAGVEAFLNAPAMRAPQGQGRQTSPSINIPGLDGIGAP